MKLITKTFIAATVAVMAVAPASAMVSQSLQGDVLSAVGANGNVQVQVIGDTVTLTGYAEDNYAVQAVERVAASQEGVNRVINNVLKAN